MAELTSSQEILKPNLLDIIKHRAQAALSFLPGFKPTEVNLDVQDISPPVAPVRLSERDAAIQALMEHYPKEKAVQMYEQSVQLSQEIEARTRGMGVFVPDTNPPYDEASYQRNHEAYMAHMNKVLKPKTQS